MRVVVNGDLWEVVRASDEWHLIVIGGAYRIDLATGLCHGIGILGGKQMTLSVHAVRRLRRASRA
jgi:hypothetical protein